MAGASYFLSLLAAVLAEFFVRGGLGIAAGLVAVLCYVAVTLLLYDIFQPVNRTLSLLAAFFNLVGLTFEGIQWNPRRVDIGLVFFGFYCLLLGYLIFKSAFLPRILGALVVFAGLAWLTFLSPALAQDLALYNLASGLAGEGSLMVWLLVMGVRWQEKASAAGAWARVSVSTTAAGSRIVLGPANTQFLFGFVPLRISDWKRWTKL
jgi:Domain of unknown function (DUF4386)